MITHFSDQKMDIYIDFTHLFSKNMNIRYEYFK